MHHDLISEIERFAASRGWSPATVTSRAVGNGRLYGNLKAGKSCTLAIAERLRDFMASAPGNAPEGADDAR